MLIPETARSGMAVAARHAANETAASRMDAAGDCYRLQGVCNSSSLSTGSIVGAEGSPLDGEKGKRADQ